MLLFSACHSPQLNMSVALGMHSVGWLWTVPKEHMSTFAMTLYLVWMIIDALTMSSMYIVVSSLVPLRQ